MHLYDLSGRVMASWRCQKQLLPVYNIIWHFVLIFAKNSRSCLICDKIISRLVSGKNFQIKIQCISD